MVETVNYEEKLRAWLQTPWDGEWQKGGEAQGRWEAAVAALLEGAEPEWPAESGSRQAVQLRHPLSGEPLTEADIDPGAFRRVSLEVIATELREGDKRAALLRLWRRGDELLHKKLREAGIEVPVLWCRELGVWRRAAVASALQGAGVHPAFLSFRVGGAQDYVDQARTTEDFWAGSYLLSWLTWKAAERLVEAWGPDCVVFPALKGQPLMDRWLGEASDGAAAVASFPNGILAVVPAEEAGRAGREAEAAFHDAWKAVSGAVREELERKLWGTGRGPASWGDLWRRQSEERAPFELFWTVTRWREGEDYGMHYRRASAGMESRKMLREFVQEDEPAPTCHQCGKREAAGEGLWEGLRGGRVRAGLRTRFRANERLCTVCVTRRLAQKLYFAKAEGGGPSIRFPSISSIAATTFLSRLMEAEDGELTRRLEEFLRRWLELTHRGPLGKQEVYRTPWPRLEKLEKGRRRPWKVLLKLDGSWWWMESYKAARLRREHPECSEREDVEGRAERAASALKDVLAWAEERGIPGPQNYVALIAGDGDHVGAWLRGDPEVWGTRKAMTMETHLAISECVGGLAGRISEEVMEGMAGGRTVFGGGDDVLAVTPVTNIAEALERYGRLFSAESHGGGVMAGKRFTVSAAALLVHVRDPLAGAVKEARRLVRAEVKEGIGRAGGALALRRQSGQETMAAAKWETEGFRQTQALIAAFRGGEPTRFVAQAVELGPGLEGLNDLEALQRMAVNLSGEQLKENVEKLVVAGQDTAEKREEAGGGWREFTNLLLMARFLGKGELS